MRMKTRTEFWTAKSSHLQKGEKEEEEEEEERGEGEGERERGGE